MHDRVDVITIKITLRKIIPNDRSYIPWKGSEGSEDLILMKPLPIFMSKISYTLQVTVLVSIWQ